MMFGFTEEQIKRYSRHIVLGLGCPASLYLAAAGVGTLGIVDSDVVELSNLQRQILHTTADEGVPKTKSAARTLQALNPDVEVVTYQTRLTRDNILDIFSGYDVIVEGSDNFPTKFLVNDACVFQRKPAVMAGILRFEGQMMTVVPHDGPCYRCVFHSPPPPGLIPSCQEAGVLGALPGLVGTLQALEAIKLVLGIGRTLNGGLLIFQALPLTFREVRVRRNPRCPVCGEHPTITELQDLTWECPTHG
ncbi:MAG: ThiF family adenylyltransferase [Deltaproteobacteria bacterium]|nr:ThiF family adenylyltransferase [Deltaproteobacteria bacterium]